MIREETIERHEAVERGGYETRARTISVLFLGLLVTIWNAAYAIEPPPLLDGARSASASLSPPVQPAPGGGEMVILAPERRYVTRAQVDDDGRLQVGCGREPASAARADPRRTP